MLLRQGTFANHLIAAQVSGIASNADAGRVNGVTPLSLIDRQAGVGGTAILSTPVILWHLKVHRGIADQIKRKLMDFRNH